MEVLIFLAIVANIALSVVMFVELEHLIDNQHEIEQAIRRLNRYLIRKGKK